MSRVSKFGRSAPFRRIVGPSLLLLLLGMLLVSLVQSRQTKSLVLDAVASESEKVLTATNASLDYVMLRADAEGLQTTLDRVAASNDQRRLYVLDLEGKVYRSSEKGRNAALPPQPSSDRFLAFPSDARIRGGVP